MQLVDDADVRIETRGDGYRIGTMTGNYSYLYKSEIRGAITAEVDSLSSVYAMIREQMSEAKRGRDSVEAKDGGSFYHFENWNEMAKTFAHHPETLVDFDPHDTPLRSVDAIGNTVTYDVTGDYIDIGRFLEGEPEVFGVGTNGKPSRFVTVFVNSCVSGFVGSEVISEFTRRTVRLVDWLEANGVRTKVVVFRTNETTHTEVTVKSFHDHLSISDIAVATNVDFHRRILFRISEYCRSTSIFGMGAAATSDHPYFTYEGIGDILPNNELFVFVEKGRTKESTNAQFDDVEQQLADILADPYAAETNVVYGSATQKNVSPTVTIQTPSNAQWTNGDPDAAWLAGRLRSYAPPRPVKPSPIISTSSAPKSKSDVILQHLKRAGWY